MAAQRRAAEEKAVKVHYLVNVALDPTAVPAQWARCIAKRACYILALAVPCADGKPSWLRLGEAACAFKRKPAAQAQQEGAFPCYCCPNSNTVSLVVTSICMLPVNAPTKGDAEASQKLLQTSSSFESHDFAANLCRPRRTRRRARRRSRSGGRRKLTRAPRRRPTPRPIGRRRRWRAPRRRCEMCKMGKSGTRPVFAAPIERRHMRPTGGDVAWVRWDFKRVALCRCREDSSALHLFVQSSAAVGGGNPWHPGQHPVVAGRIRV